MWWLMQQVLQTIHKETSCARVSAKEKEGVFFSQEPLKPSGGWRIGITLEDTEWTLNIKTEDHKYGMLLQWNVIGKVCVFNKL